MNIGGTTGTLFDSTSGGVFGNEQYKNYGNVSKEHFKGSSGSGGSGLGLFATGAAIGSSSSSGSGNNERCPLNDMSIYCRLSRGTSIVSMVIYLIFVFFMIMAFLYFLYNYMRGKK